MSMAAIKVFPSTRYSRMGKLFTGDSADRAESRDCSTAIAMIPQNLLDAINGTRYSSSLATHQVYGFTDADIQIDASHRDSGVHELLHPISAGPDWVTAESYSGITMS